MWNSAILQQSLSFCFPYKESCWFLVYKKFKDVSPLDKAITYIHIPFLIYWVIFLCSFKSFGTITCIFFQWEKWRGSLIPDLLALLGYFPWLYWVISLYRVISLDFQPRWRRSWSLTASSPPTTATLPASWGSLPTLSCWSPTGASLWTTWPMLSGSPQNSWISKYWLGWMSKKIVFTCIRVNKTGNFSYVDVVF